MPNLSRYMCHQQHSNKKLSMRQKHTTELISITDVFSHNDSHLHSRSADHYIENVERRWAPFRAQARSSDAPERHFESQKRRMNPKSADLSRRALSFPFWVEDHSWCPPWAEVRTCCKTHYKTSAKLVKVVKTRTQRVGWGGGVHLSGGHQVAFRATKQILF